MCEVMPTINEGDPLGSPHGTDADANFEQLMVNMLDEREKLLESLRENQETLAATQSRLQDALHERDQLQCHLNSALPQVRPDSLHLPHPLPLTQPFRALSFWALSSLRLLASQQMEFTEHLLSFALLHNTFPCYSQAPQAEIGSTWRKGWTLMREENPALVANCSEPMQPEGGRLYWKDTSTLEAPHQGPVLGSGGWRTTENGDGRSLRPLIAQMKKTRGITWKIIGRAVIPPLFSSINMTTSNNGHHLLCFLCAKHFDWNFLH